MHLSEDFSKTYRINLKSGVKNDPPLGFLVDGVDVVENFCVFRRKQTTYSDSTQLFVPFNPSHLPILQLQKSR